MEAIYSAYIYTYIQYIYQVRGMALCLLNLFMFMYTVHYSIYSTYIYIPGERYCSVSSQPLLVYVHCTLLYIQYIYIYQVRGRALCLLNLFLFMYTVHSCSLYCVLYSVHSTVKSLVHSTIVCTPNSLCNVHCTDVGVCTVHSYVYS